VFDLRLPLLLYMAPAVLGIVGIHSLHYVWHANGNESTVHTVQELLYIVLFLSIFYLLYSKAKVSLEKSAHWYRTLLGVSPVMISVHKDGKFVYVNQAGVDLLGITANKELIGMEIANFTHPDEVDLVQSRVYEVEVEKRSVYVEQLKLIRANGEVIDVESKAIPFPINGADATLVVVQDVTQRNLAELKIRESEKKYRTLVEQTPNGLWNMNCEGEIVSINPAAQGLSGYSQGELLSRHLGTLFAPKDVQAVHQKIDLALRGEPSELEQLMVHKSGKLVELNIRYVPTVMDGEIVGVFAVAQDISERKRAQEELCSTKELLESFVEHSKDTIVVVDLEGIVLRANGAFEDMFGWIRDDVLGRRLPVIWDQGPVTLSNVFAQVAAGTAVTHIEMMCTKRDGTTIYIDATFSPIHDAEAEVFAISVVGRDVTERKQSAEELRQSEERYRLIADNMSDLVAVLDAQGLVQYASPSHAKVLGVSADFYVGQSALQFVHPQDIESVRARIVEIVRTKRPETTEFRYRHQENRWIVLEARAVPVLGEDAKVVSILVSSRDITKRKEMEQELQEAESRYRSLVEQASMGVFIYQNGHLAYVNPRFLEIFHLNEDEVLNLSPSRLIVEEDYADLRSKFSDTLREGSRFNYRIRGITKNADQIHLQLYGTAIVHHGVPAIIGMIDDITEHVRTQELLRKSERLSAIGELAAGVAHEIRNPLTAIKGFLQLLQTSTVGTEKTYVQIVLAELERINQIVTELLFLAKPAVSKFHVANIHALLNDVTVLLNTQALMKNIEIVTRYETSRPFVWCDEQQLKQVFLNVLKNAIEAMPRGGKVMIQTLTRENSQTLLVSVLDHGVGIPQERLAKLGEPFFTTKEKGTGLGLMVSYRIIEAHQGRLHIQSELNKGTTVTLELPVTRDSQ